MDTAPDAHECGTKRAALGPSVLRRTDRKDALYTDCVGPSRHSKAQGTPVRIWGLLNDGELKVSILEDGVVMNR